MHELSIAINLIEIAEEEANKRGLRVIALHLRLGPLSGVVKEALLSAYGLAREGTPLAAAELRIEDVPVMLACGPCGATRPAVSLQQLCCAECGTASGEVVSGRELELVALEAE